MHFSTTHVADDAEETDTGVTKQGLIAKPEEEDIGTGRLFCMINDALDVDLTDGFGRACITNVTLALDDETPEFGE